MDNQPEPQKSPLPQQTSPELVTQTVEENINEAAIEIGEILKRRGLGMQAVIQVFKPESPVIAMGNGEVPAELLKAIGQEKGDPIEEKKDETQTGTTA